MTVLGSKIGVDDEDFLVASLIERCPKSMMSRELVTNAVEAAMTASPGRCVVQIGAVTIDGTPKLCIWNSGNGMDAEELFRMCDIASSIGKQKGLERNFGMGAKVAALPSNRHGMRYRSCRRGRVHEVVIGHRDGVYIRLPQALPGDGIMAVVANVTAQAWDDGRPLSEDWTEVVLLGNRPDQDTVHDPFDHDPESTPDWLSNELYKRFFRLPEGCRVELLEGAPKAGKQTRFETIAQRALTAFARYECVDLSDGKRIHYLYDEADTTNLWVNRSGYGAMQEAKSMAGVVHRNEIYALEYSGSWTRLAPGFGITFGSRQISVFVELPDDFPVMVDGYRQHLRYREGPQEQVALQDLSKFVRQHRPDWLVTLMKEISPNLSLGQGLRQELESLMRRLGIPPRRHSPPVYAPPPLATADTTNSPPDLEADRPPDDAAAEELPDDFAPAIYFLDDDIELSERQMLGRAARYYSDVHQLYINQRYSALARAEAALRAMLIERNAVEDQQAIRIEAQRLIARRIGHAVAYGLAKDLPEERWPDWAVKASLSPESLSIAADDFELLLPAACDALAAARPAA